MKILIETTVSLTPEQVGTLEHFTKALVTCYHGAATVTKLPDIEAWIEGLTYFDVLNPPKWVVDYVKEYGVHTGDSTIAVRVGRFELYYSRMELIIFEN